MKIRIPAVGIATALLLAGCATQPKPLQGAFQSITPHQAAADRLEGAMVRWGGRIIRTEPRPDRTCFEVISTKLNADGRPVWASDDTWGRFIACRTGFYDPALFQPNREVTFTGRIEGYEDRKVEEYLGTGVRLVWVLQPATRTAMVYRADGTVARIPATGALDGEDVLPGFGCELATIMPRA